MATDSGYGSDYAVTPDYLDGITNAVPPAAYQSFYPPATGQSDNTAQVIVNVPPDAKVWFDDKPTTSTGAVRQFDSPPLKPGTRYTYDVKASWTENGREVTRTRQVEVSAGDHVNVQFLASPTTTGKAAATHD